MKNRTLIQELAEALQSRIDNCPRTHGVMGCSWCEPDRELLERYRASYHFHNGYALEPS